MPLSLIVIMCVFCVALGCLCGYRFTKVCRKVDGQIIITHNDEGDVEFAGMTINTDIPVLISQRELVLKINLERASDS